MMRASSTLYALLITLLMSLVCGSLILFAFSARQLAGHLHEKQLLQEKGMNTIRLLLSDTTHQLTNEKIPFEYMNDEGAEVSKFSSAWGTLRLLSTTLETGKSSRTFNVLAGWRPVHAGPVNVYLAEQRSPLYLGGQALLSGYIAAGVPGFKRAYGQDEFYQREKMYEGTLVESRENLPMSFLETFYQNRALLRGEFTPEDSIKEMSACENVQLQQGFDEQRLIITSSDTLFLVSGTAEGHIVFYSSTAVRIAAGFSTKNVLVVSPLILVEKGFEGDAQLISAGNILIGKEVRLRYPSGILHIDGMDAEHSGGAVLMDTSSSFSGSVLMLGLNKGLNASVFKCSDRTTLSGFVFCESRAEVRGRIEGFFFATKLVSITSSSYRENYLVNGQLVAWPQADLFVGPVPDGNSEPLNIARWIKK